MLIRSSCEEYLATVGNEIFDLVIADPPYFQICGEFDYLWKTVDEYIVWSKNWLRECHRVLKPTGTIYLWGAIGYGRGYPLFKLCDWLETDGLFTVRNWITQRNSRGYGTKRGFMCAREELVFMTKSDNYTWNTAYLDEPTNRSDLGADGKPRKSSYKRCSDVWIDITEASQSSAERFQLPNGSTFPTVKSQKLCERIITASSNVGDNVFIPFGGSGSEAVSCKKLERKFVVTEIYPQYQQIIQSRLDDIAETILR